MHVAITGASAGIGEALVREYARAGASVTLVARRKELLDRIAGEVGGRTFTSAADLADPTRATDWIAPAEAALGPIDVLVNNAGSQIVAPFDSVSVEDGEALLRLDLLTPLRLMHALAPAMIARGRGAIVNVSSLAAISTLPGMAHYNAAKAGFAAASETARVELRRHGVRVLTVYPGPVKTALADAAYDHYPPSRVARMLPEGTVEVLARRIRRVAERGGARIIYPRIYHLVRWFPNITRAITDRIAPHALRPALAPSRAANG